MATTNKHGLPQPLMNLLKRDDYTRGDARISITQLIGSPRISILREAHKNEITEDISDKFWALMGTNIHKILERGADEEHLAEERLFMDVDGVRISGGIDLQRTRDGKVGIVDWKFTSVYSATSSKPDWEAQLNCYAHLVRVSKLVKVESVEVCAILRDWSGSKAKVALRRAGVYGDPDYPQAPVIMVPFRLWSPMEAEDYIHTRVQVHRDAARARDWGEQLPLCTDAERWAKPTTYAVHLNKSRRAARVFDARDDADLFLAGRLAQGQSGEVVERAGVATRCEGNYCSVSQFCDQYRDVSSGVVVHGDDDDEGN